MTSLTGVGVGGGVAIGPASRLDVAERARSEGTPADGVESTDPTVEWERFETARETASEELATLRAAADGEAADVLETHQTVLRDPALESRVREAIEEGARAERAVSTALDEWIRRFESRGGHTAARADDLRDLAARLRRAFDGRNAEPTTVPDGCVLLADRLTPSAAVRLDLESVAAVVTCGGSRTAHAALVARGRGVPMVVDVGDDLQSVEDGTTLRVDADAGRVDVRPADSESTSTAAAARSPEATHDTVRTADGRAVGVAANVGSGSEAERAASVGADGVGLFRTELLALGRPEGGIPSEREQADHYRRALDAFPSGSIAVRTFDFGADKPGPGDATEGGRGVARSLANPDRFERQLRAVCRANAAGAGEATVVLPHVTRVEEVVAAREHLENAVETLDERGVPCARPSVEVMVETPAAVELASDLAAHVDGFSLGTNDLVAHLFGHDRSDASADPASPAVFRAVRRVAEAARNGEVALRCCGAAAADADVAAALVGLGVDSLSVAPAEVGRVKGFLDGLDREAARARAERAAAAETVADARDALSGWSS